MQVKVAYHYSVLLLDPIASYFSADSSLSPHIHWARIGYGLEGPDGPQPQIILTTGHDQTTNSYPCYFLPRLPHHWPTTAQTIPFSLS